MAPGRLVSHKSFRKEKREKRKRKGSVRLATLLRIGSGASYRNLGQIFHRPLMPSVANEAFSSLAIDIGSTSQV